MDPSGKFLYVGSGTNVAIHRFELNPDGTLKKDVAGHIMGGKRYGVFEGDSPDKIGFGPMFTGSIVHHPTLGVMYHTGQGGAVLLFR
jgi:hypothetical protein